MRVPSMHIPNANLCVDARKPGTAHLKERRDCAWLQQRPRSATGALPGGLQHVRLCGRNQQPGLHSSSSGVVDAPGFLKRASLKTLAVVCHQAHANETSNCPPDMAALHIVVTGNIPQGSVKVVGDPTCLGRWCPQQAPEAVRSSPDSLELRVHVKPSRMPFEYLLMIADESGNFCKWEADTHRKLRITGADVGHTAKVVLEWGQPKNGHHDDRSSTEFPPEAAIGKFQGAAASSELISSDPDDCWDKEFKDYEICGNLDWPVNPDDADVLDTIRDEVLDRDYPVIPGRVRQLPLRALEEAGRRAAARQATVRDIQ